MEYDLAIPPFAPLDAEAIKRVDQCVQALVAMWRFCLHPPQTPPDVAGLGEHLKRLGDLRAPLVQRHHVRCGSIETAQQVEAWSVNITRRALQECGFGFIHINALKQRSLPLPSDLVIPVRRLTGNLAVYLRMALNSYVEYLGWCAAQGTQAGTDISPQRRARHAGQASAATDVAHQLLVLHVALAGYEPGNLADLAWRFVRYNVVFTHLGLEGV